MRYNTHTLANGLRIIHLPSASPVVYCGYGIAAGTRNELPGEEGLAHFCEHAAFKGTARRRAWHIMNCLERVGGDLNAFTNKEDTMYHAAILKDDIGRAVDLLTDIVFRSQYPQAELDREVEVICDEIESYNDTPAELIYDEFENLLFAGHPLGHNILGAAGRLRTYRSADLRRFAARHYRPANAIFFAYGDLDFARLVRLLERHTADIAAPPAARAAAGAAAGAAIPGAPAAGAGAGPLPPYCPQEAVVQRPTHQAHVMMGNRTFPVTDSRRIALYLLNNILGGPGMNARLNLSLRERNGLVYAVESSMASYSDTGVWCVYFGCDPHDAARCRRLVRRELDRMAGRELTPSQLRAAKKQLKGQIAVACDSRESFALDFAKSYLHRGWEKDVSRLFAQLDALTATELQQVAAQVFDPGLMTTLVFSPG